jgi:lipid II:glycine glycyltransferase (peptidoglycan interpeptide bridge formation enzyme)
MREVKQQGSRHGVISIEGQEAGIVQMQEVSLFNKFIHYIAIDRGPLWFKGFGKAEHLSAFADAIDQEFPERMLRRRRIMFEYRSNNEFQSIGKMKRNNKLKRYQTYMLDLSKPLGDIRAGLKKSWRYELSKAEKINLDIIHDADLSTLSHFLKTYIEDRLKKGYPGASPKMLAALCKYATLSGDCYLLNATEDDEIIASILVFKHGKGATYQAGWTTHYGRDKNAHHLLLWRAIEMLKAAGATEFDLGGHGDHTEGLKTFKSGLGGHEITLIGSYG